MRDSVFLKAALGVALPAASAAADIRAWTPADGVVPNPGGGEVVIREAELSYPDGVGGWSAPELNVFYQIRFGETWKVTLWKAKGS
ncbi:MAG: hypothetical protein NTW26_03370 [bacterium]|nr:hypothetical protein [bacterium]